MDNSPFARLPAELRVRIFEFALAIPDRDASSIRFTVRERMSFANYMTANNRLAIIAICRQLRFEAKSLFYCIHKLSFYPGPVLEQLDEQPYNGDPHKDEKGLHAQFQDCIRRLSGFLEHVGEVSQRKIGEVEIYLGNFTTYDSRNVAFLKYWLSNEIACMMNLFERSTTKVFVYFPRIIYSERTTAMMLDIAIDVSDTETAQREIQVLIEDEREEKNRVWTDDIARGLEQCQERLHDFVNAMHRQHYRS